MKIYTVGDIYILYIFSISNTLEPVGALNPSVSSNSRETG